MNIKYDNKIKERQHFEIGETLKKTLECDLMNSPSFTSNQGCQ